MITNLLLYLILLSPLIDSRREKIDNWLDTKVSEWRFHLGDIPGAEKPDFDDLQWETAMIGHRWWPNESTCWFRTTITVPETIMGFSTAGKSIRLICSMDNEANVYTNGEFRQHFAWRKGDAILTETGKLGAVISIAVQGINHPGFGQFLEARLGTDESLSAYSSIHDLLQKIDLIQSHLTVDEPEWKQTIEKIYAVFDFDRISNPKLSSPNRLEMIQAFVAQANDILMKIPQTTPDRLKRLEAELKNLDKLIDAGNAKGLSLDQVKMRARVIRSFIQYAKDDFAQTDGWKKVRAERTAAYLERLSQETYIEAENVLKNPAMDQRVPRYHTGRLSIRDGAFWQEGRPVFLNGVGHFGQVRQDIPILPEYGMNIIQIEIGPSNVLNEDGTISLEPLENNILKYLKAGEEHNVAVCVLLSPHYFPEWAIRQHPELAEAGHGFMKYDIDHPVARELIEKFLRAVVPRMASYKSLHSFCLSNEPQYVSRTEVSAKLFHEWLAKRHQSIERLNDLYGTHYERFDEVPQATRDFSPPAYIDWCWFNQERFWNWHHWMVDIIHESAPEIPVHAKSMADAWRGSEEFELGVNHEEFAHLGKITGNDCTVIPTREPDYPYAQHWLRQAMHYDFQRGAAPDQPIFNTENHIIPDDNPLFISAGHIYTALWQGAIYGMGASTIWVWERGEGKDMFDNILTRPNCVEAAGRASLDLQRLAPLVVRLSNLKPEVGLFYAWNSNVRDNNTRDASTIAYEGLANLGVRIKIVTENTIRAGALQGLAVVVAAKTAWVHPETARVFAEYIAQGGIVFTIEPTFSQDEYGRSQPELSAWKDDGLRSGRVVRLDTPVTAQAIRDLVGERLKQIKRGTPIQLYDRYGDPLWGVLWLGLEDGDRYVINVVNERRDPQIIKLPISSHAKIKDLITGQLFQREFELEPLHPLLLEVAKKDLAPYTMDRRPDF